ncbi:MAG: cytochrome c [Rickettsiales bacterium TMED289]|nr:MAG: cytochrome c [Rickettsiales bacterium TMED289]|tara:strand:- start:705 stop:1313 length:609 start_codon:yes stop_codon:yes gene_type:complete
MRINLIIISALLLTGCFRGSKFESPPIHLNPNMDNQQKYRSLEESNFFEDGSTMRKPIEGTIARGMIAENHSYLSGKNDDGSYLMNNPIELSIEVLNRGQDRYNIYCSVCHSQVGNGKGIVTQYEYPVIPANLHDQRIREQADGEMYNTIVYGLRSMPAYGYQINTDDVWSIIHYVRALQRSQNATIEDLPKDEQSRLNETS